jgi:nucleoside-diphosphate-sugar epimerase
MNKIGVLGCGRVGFPLAKTLLDNGYKVNGTARSSDKILKLSKSGINSYQYVINKNFNESRFYRSLDLLIITVPFGKNKMKSKGFDDFITQLVEITKKESIKNVIYLSSISVYGSSNRLLDEKTKCNPVSKSAIKILSVEKILNNGPFKTINIRLGGLIGNNIHPINSISGKEFNKGDQFINLIHIDDVVGIILKILDRFPNENNTYNAVSPFHPLKKDYYTLIAKELKVLPPKFIIGEKLRKIISSDKLIKEFEYNFKRKKLLINS